MKLIDENLKNPETKKSKRSMHFANVKMDLEEIAQINPNPIKVIILSDCWTSNRLTAI